MTVYAYFSATVLATKIMILGEKNKTTTYTSTHHLCFCMIRNIKARIWSQHIKIMFLYARKKQVSVSNHSKKVVNK